MALGVTFLVFFLMSFSPSNPPTRRWARLRPRGNRKYHEEFGLDDPRPFATFVTWETFFMAILAPTARSAVRLPTAQDGFPVTMQLTFLACLRHNNSRSPLV
jgi:peptide/nickel transport system permease protein